MLTGGSVLKKMARRHVLEISLARFANEKKIEQATQTSEAVELVTGRGTGRVDSLPANASCL